MNIDTMSLKMSILGVDAGCRKGEEISPTEEIRRGLNQMDVIGLKKGRPTRNLWLIRL